MSQTLGRPKRSFMVGFPAELSWLKGNEEVGRRGRLGGEVGDFQGGCEAGVLPFDLFRAAKRVEEEGGGAPSKLANTFSG